MKEFVLDLFSGKLHREYHYGPDPVTSDVSIDRKLVKLVKKKKCIISFSLNLL